MRLAKIAFAISLVLVMSVVCICSSSHAAPETYTRTLQPIGNGFAIVDVAQTTKYQVGDPDYTTTYVNRLPSQGAISDFNTSTSKVYGGFTCYGTGVEDLVSYNLGYNPATLASNGVLNVWRNHIARALTGNSITALAVGGAANNGSLAVRADGGSGTLSGYFKVDGTSNVSSPVLIQSFMDYGTTAKFLVKSDSTNNTYIIPTIGKSNSNPLLVGNNFGNWQVTARDTFSPDPNTTAFQPHARQLSAYETRGQMAVNDTAGIIAVASKDSLGNTARMIVYKYTDNGTSVSIDPGFPKIFDYVNIMPGYKIHNANHFSQSPFRGPMNISINDNGDIAWPVAIVPDTYTGDPRYADRRGILMLPAGSSSVSNIKIVVDTATAGAPIFYDPSENFNHAIGGVAIDNDRNVFFHYSNWVGTFGGNRVYAPCIFKANYNTATQSYGNYEPIVWRGLNWQSEGKIKLIAYWQIVNQSGQYYANPMAFAAPNINRSKISGTGPQFSTGGLSIQVGLAEKQPYDPDVPPSDTTSGLNMSTCYIAPTTMLPQTTTILQAKKLAEGSPVNLTKNIYVVAKAGRVSRLSDPNDPNSTVKTYYQYYISDGVSRIRLSSIRPDFEVGDRIYTSSRIWENDDQLDELYLPSDGDVLVAKGNGTTDIAPYGMNSKAVGAGYGLSTEGMWVKVAGRVIAKDMVNKTFTISDGADNIIVKCGDVLSKTPYLTLADLIAHPTAGNIVSVTGDVEFGSPKTITMRYEFDESLFNPPTNLLQIDYTKPIDVVVVYN
ncbi:MAG: hypothetical protein SNJ70_05845 [Armatimonadota bacterium]